MRFPSIKAVRKVLTKTKRFVVSHKMTNTPDDETVDVRLQVIRSGYWSLFHGDPSYDQDHRGFWGSSCISYKRENLTKIAKDLINQTKTHKAESLA
jgi:hypothetical protein